ncbi:MAG TPA: FAD-binding oxidoreductase [Puia sp.]|jgi:ferredoxin-NADP reductase|nr:FAD-binding oxidoreductase [Puia sp.]
MPHIQKILSIAAVTHDVRCIRLEKPDNYSFIPGQATDVTLDKDGWREEKRPFTFTSLNSDPYLEFTIKSYANHDGVTKQIGLLETDDHLIIDEPWGAIHYKGEGYFIAGGAGITPFMAIFRQLHQVGLIGKNRLFFSNKTPADIIYRSELIRIFGGNAVFVLTQKGEDANNLDFIDQAFLKSHVQQPGKYFYVCGPDPMVQGINEILAGLGANPQTLIFEK